MVRKTSQQKAEWAKKRSRIVDLHAVDGDWRSLAVDLGVPQPTAGLVKGIEKILVVEILNQRLLLSTKMAHIQGKIPDALAMRDIVEFLSTI